MMDALSEWIKSQSNIKPLLERILSWIPDLLSAILIMAFFYALWRVLNSVVGAVNRRSKLDTTAASFLQTVVKYTIFSVGAVSALSKVGINTASILTSLGVAGLTIGFAAKDALSNMISGLFIFWDRPFVIGDLVEIDGNYGRVDSITMRSTRVVTPDGRMLAVPNSVIVNSTVASYTNFPHLRLDIPFTVSVNEDIGRVRRIALGLCEDAEALMPTPSPVVVVTALNDYNIGMELRVWLKDEKTHVLARHDLRELLFLALRDAGVDMPYETLALTPVTVMEAASR